MDFVKKIISKFGGGLTTKSSTSNPSKSGSMYIDAGFVNRAFAYKFSTRNFREFICNAYGNNPYVSMVTDRISTVQSTLPRSFKKEIGENEYETVEVDKQLKKMLTRRPNPLQSAIEFRKEYTQYYLTAGNVIIYGVNSLVNGTEAEIRLGFSKYKEIYAADVKNVEIIGKNGINEYGEPEYYIIHNAKGYNGLTKKIPAKDVLHIKEPNIIHNSYWGLPKLFAQQKSYQGSTENFNARVNMYHNQGSVGIVSPKDASMPLLTDEQDEIQSIWDEKNSGSDKFGKRYVASVPVDYTAIGLTAADMELIKATVSDLRTVCGAFNVDSVLFNDIAGASLRNRPEAEKSMYVNVELPLADLIDEAISFWLIQENYGEEDVFYTVDLKRIALLNQPNVELSTKVRGEVEKGILSPEQALAILYPELEYDENAQAQGSRSHQEDPKPTTQDLISIQSALGAGEITEAAAIAMLVELFNFEESTARELLGL